MKIFDILFCVFYRKKLEKDKDLLVLLSSIDLSIYQVVVLIFTFVTIGRFSMLINVYLQDYISSSIFLKVILVCGAIFCLNVLNYFTYCRKQYFSSRIEPMITQKKYDSIKPWMLYFGLAVFFIINAPFWN